ncbi:hypothetical protein QDW14_08150 [Corynebacterium bovis]|nr:hypothetical protein [Corynebacterium bovis]MDH2456441.1 hypothetical protein [Corynebacterium bovis]
MNLFQSWADLAIQLLRDYPLTNLPVYLTYTPEPFTAQNLMNMGSSGS